MFKPLRDLRKYIKDRTAIDLFEDDEAFNTFLLASEIRNLIAHNDCAINKLFKRRLAGIEHDIKVGMANKLLLTDDLVRKLSYKADAIVFRFDKIASHKFDLQKHDRFGLVMLRDSDDSR